MTDITIIDTMSDDNKISVAIPRNDEHFHERPFFAYGLFKKGQLCFPAIADCVEEVFPDEINRKMHIRDGVPVILNEPSTFKTRGHRIHFNEKAKEAYEKISANQPRNVYHWDVICIGEKEYNILVTDKLEGTFLSVGENGNYLDEFDGKDDPFFSGMTEFIRNELDRIGEDDENDFFRVQMLYMLLWTAIERYCVFKYDVSKNQGEYLDNFADDPLFKEAFSKANFGKRDPVYSAITASPFYFNMNRNRFIVNHYYTIRCNVAHRGKDGNNDFRPLIKSLYELLDIFDEIMEKSFER